MNGNLKITGSNNKYLVLGYEYRGELIANKLIVNSQHKVKIASNGGRTLEESVPNQVFTLDINNVIIYDKHVHVDAWFVDEECNGGRTEMELYWK